MGHTLKHQKSLLTRVRRIKGQAASLETALESGEECLKVLQQVAAELLEGHIKEHLMNESATEAERTQDLEEIVSVIRSYLK
jgi:DNA-binding FrmR family transcriptional regulator